MFDVMSSTIVAIATPPGMGGVAVVRLSGPDSWRVAQQLMKHPGRLKAPGRVVLDWLVDPGDGQVVDQVLWVPFKAPKSYTGQDVVEIQCHGGPVVAQMIVRACRQLGAELAAPGAFTQRAVLNGRLDLTQAESVLDLIHAQGEALVKVAAHNLQQHALGRQLEAYWKDLQSVQAQMVASIDFPDEVDEPDRTALQAVLAGLLNQLDEQLALNSQQQVLRDGVEVALVGAPNAGKSSLFNALLQADRAMVTPIAGTTRDVLRETMAIAGVPVTLNDTAGLRDSDDTLEQMGVERTLGVMATAALQVVVVDATVPVPETVKALLDQAEPSQTLLVWNKVDPDTSTQPPVLKSAIAQVSVSAQYGVGIVAVRDWLAQAVQAQVGLGNVPFLLSGRQIDELTVMRQDVALAHQALGQATVPLDLVTVHLTHALLVLEGLMGKDTTEGVLDAVFTQFCVGK